MARETGVSHCLHFAMRQLAKSGRPQLTINVRWGFSRRNFLEEEKKKINTGAVPFGAEQHGPLMQVHNVELHDRDAQVSHE